MISAIACVLEDNNNWYIGADNDLLFDIRSDKKLFHEYTKGSVLICGYNTYKTLPKSITDNYGIIVITRDHYKDFESHDIREALEGKTISRGSAGGTIVSINIFQFQNNFIVIGGAQIYKEFLFDIKSFIITKVTRQHAYDSKDLLNKAVQMINLENPNYLNGDSSCEFIINTIAKNIKEVDGKTGTFVMFDIIDYMSKSHASEDNHNRVCKIVENFIK